ncbi:hypothetical protein E3O85_RS13790 [Enterococcus hirae]
MNAYGVTDEKELTEAKLAVEAPNQFIVEGKDITTLEGLQYAKGLHKVRLKAHNYGQLDFSVFDSLKLSVADFANAHLSQEQFNHLHFNTEMPLDISLDVDPKADEKGESHVYNLSSLKEVKQYSYGSFSGQTITESKQKLEGNTLIVKVKDIKNIDGSIPKITPSNGGKYDAEKGTITWTGLTENITSLNYTWKNDDGHTFTGTVTIPVELQAYHIVPLFAQTKCLGNSPNCSDLSLWSKDDQATNNYFVFHPVKGDIVKISSKDNSHWLTTKGKQGNIITQTTNKQGASYWKLVHLDQNRVAYHYVEYTEIDPNAYKHFKGGIHHEGPFSYHPIPIIEDSNLSLNICGGNDTDGTKAILYPSSYDSYPNQQFILEKEN